MFVRTLYATGDPAELDGAVEALSTEGRRLLSEQPGFRGFGMVVDRELGKLATATWWEDEKSRTASDEKLRGRREQLVAPFARTLATDNWEGVVARPPKDLGAGAWFRMIRLELDPSAAGLLAETFEKTALPKLQAMPGFAGGSLLLNEARDRGVVGVFWADRNALAASRAAVASLRGETTAKARVVTRSLEEFEVVFASVPQPS